MVDTSLTGSRRALLTAGATTLAALAGCSGVQFGGGEDAESPTESPLDRIAIRSDTGKVEPLRLTLVYGPPGERTERPVWKTVEAPADGGTLSIARRLDTGAGVYSLTAVAKRHDNHEVISFNSQVDGGPERHQFEVVVKETGDVWVNLNQAGETVSVPR